MDANTYHVFTQCTWQRCHVPDREPDYISYSRDRDRGGYKISSRYWYEADSVIRESNHWGQVATCWWVVEGLENAAASLSRNGACAVVDGTICAKANFGDFTFQSQNDFYYANDEQQIKILASIILGSKSVQTAFVQAVGMDIDALALKTVFVKNEKRWQDFKKAPSL